MKYKAIEDAMLENEKLGYVERKGKNKSGEVLWALTKSGKKHIEQLLKKVEQSAS